MGRRNVQTPFAVQLCKKKLSSSLHLHNCQPTELIRPGWMDKSTHFPSSTEFITNTILPDALAAAAAANRDAKLFPCYDPEAPCRLVPGWTWTDSSFCRSSDVYTGHTKNDTSLYLYVCNHFKLNCTVESLQSNVFKLSPFTEHTSHFGLWDSDDVSNWYRKKRRRRRYLRCWSQCGRTIQTKPRWVSD